MKSDKQKINMESQLCRSSNPLVAVNEGIFYLFARFLPVQRVSKMLWRGIRNKCSRKEVECWSGVV